MTTTHTPASLLALYRDDPRKLDAVAHRLVFPNENVQWVSATKFELIPRDGERWGGIPEYSSDLNHAVLLEARLAERGLDRAYDRMLVESVLDGYYAHMDESDIERLRGASARERTIAAILAAQSS